MRWCSYSWSKPRNKITQNSVLQWPRLNYSKCEKPLLVFTLEQLCLISFVVHHIHLVDRWRCLIMVLLSAQWGSILLLPGSRWDTSLYLPSWCKMQRKVNFDWPSFSHHGDRSCHVTKLPDCATHLFPWMQRHMLYSYTLFQYTAEWYIHVYMLCRLILAQVSL